MVGGAGAVDDASPIDSGGAVTGGTAWKEALALYRETPEAGFAHTAQSHGLVIPAAGPCGKWEKALSLLENMKDKGFYPDRYTHAACITALDNGQCDRALVSLNDTKARAEGEGSEAKERREERGQQGLCAVTPHVFRYTAAIAPCGKVSRREKVLASLNEMADAKLVPNMARTGAPWRFVGSATCLRGSSISSRRRC